MRQLLKGFALRLASVLLGLFVALLILEIAVRLLAPSDIALLIPDEVLAQLVVAGG